MALPISFLLVSTRTINRIAAGWLKHLTADFTAPRLARLSPILFAPCGRPTIGGSAIVLLTFLAQPMDLTWPINLDFDPGVASHTLLLRPLLLRLPRGFHRAAIIRNSYYSQWQARYAYWQLPRFHTNIDRRCFFVVAYAEGQFLNLAAEFSLLNERSDFENSGTDRRFLGHTSARTIVRLMAWSAECLHIRPYDAGSR
jgi:hypothetical protein